MISSSILAVYFLELTETIKIMLIKSIETARAGVEYSIRGEKLPPDEKVDRVTLKTFKNNFVKKTLKRPCNSLKERNGR